MSAIDSEARDMAERANIGVAEVIIKTESFARRVNTVEVSTAEILAQARIIKWGLAGVLIAIVSAMGLVWTRVEGQASVAREVAVIAAQGAVHRETLSCETRARAWIDEAAIAAVRRRDEQAVGLTVRR